MKSTVRSNFNENFGEKVLMSPVNSAQDPLTENVKRWKRVKRSIQTNT